MCRFMLNCCQDYTEHGRKSLTGDASNVWFDKCFTVLGYQDGWTGFNIEHSGLDAMVFITAQEYILVNEKYDGKDVFKTDTPRNLPSPKEYVRLKNESNSQYSCCWRCCETFP